MGREVDQTPTTSLLADQRSHWDRGERVPVEHYLQDHPGLSENTEILLDLIYAEVVLRREAGENPTPDEYAVRFPALADPIRTQFEVDSALGSALTQPGNDGPDDFQVFPEAPPGYEILEEIGRGGMGVVYKARHKLLDRLVALKMIRTGEFADPAERLRFDAEARAVAQLSHPNIIHIYEIGEANGLPFLALEYVPGESLADALHGDPFDPRMAATLTARLARAIQHAHEAGIVHRDLKPANILLSQRSGAGGQTPGVGSATFVPKITDFGLVKRMGVDGPTRTGDFLGTPNFAPPEQAIGRSDLGPAADVYSLGAILYQMLTGRPPFVGATPLETLDQVRFAEPVPPSRLRPKLPRDLETIVLKCLHKEPARRYSSAAELAADLDRFRNGQVVRARSVGVIERTIKWGRRRPAIAGMLSLIVLLATASLVTVTALWRQAASARDSERVWHGKEVVQRKRAEARAAELLIANARFAWSTDDLHGARKSLAECPNEYRNAEWANLNRACAASRLLVPPGSSPIECLAVSGDGKAIAFGIPGNRVRVWDVDQGRETLNLHLPGRAARSLAFTACGKLAVVMSTALNASGKVREFVELVHIDVATSRLNSVSKRQDRPLRNEVSPDGRHVVILPYESKIAYLLDSETGKELRQIEARTGFIRKVAFSPNGRYLVTIATPRELRLWNIESGLLAAEYISVDNFFGIHAAAAGDSGHGVAAAIDTPGRNSEIALYQGNEKPRRVTTHLSNIGDVLFSHDGRWVAATGLTSTSIRIWDTATGREEMTLRGHPTPVRCLQFSPDDRQLIAGYADGRVVVWNLASESAD